MARPRLRVYPDTSVFGAPFDEEFAERVADFWHAAKRGRYDLVVSDLTLDELGRAPAPVRALLDDVPQACILPIARSDESRELAAAYLRHGILPERMESDAQHVALATIAGADVLVSLNFKHIVNLRRIRVFHAVNLELGYRPIEIRSPMEVGEDD